MADAFDDALTDLKDALTSGEEVDAAIVSVAGDHGLKPDALRNRAAKRWGDLSSFGTINRERELEAMTRDKESDLLLRARLASAKPVSEWTEADRDALSWAKYINRYWRS